MGGSKFYGVNIMGSDLYLRGVWGTSPKKIDEYEML